MATVQEPVTNPVMPLPVERDEPLFEIICGQYVELPPMSTLASMIATLLGFELGKFTRAHNIGWVVVENLFLINTSKKTIRRPDVAYVSYERWPHDKPLPEVDNSWDVIPDLAVEVVSLTDRAEELIEKIEEYFQAGVRLVWVVYPRRRTIHVYQSPSEIHGLAGDMELGGGEVLPGFKLKLADWFPRQGGEANGQ